jgi:hypothetical protein
VKRPMTAQAAVTSVFSPFVDTKVAVCQPTLVQTPQPLAPYQKQQLASFRIRACFLNSTQTQQKRCTQETATLPPLLQPFVLPTKSNKSRLSHASKPLRPRLEYGSSYGQSPDITKQEVTYTANESSANDEASRPPRTLWHPLVQPSMCHSLSCTRQKP